MPERPFTLTAAAVIEVIEGIAAIGFGLFVGWETIAGEPMDPASAIGVTVLALLGGIGMVAVCRGLLLGLQWSRSPAVVTQLFALPVAWSLVQSEQYAYGVPLAAAAIVALVLLLSPPTGKALYRDADGDADGDKGGDEGGDKGGDKGGDEGRLQGDGEREGRAQSGGDGEGADRD